MAKQVLLDAGPLGMISHPRPNKAIADWLRRLLSAGIPCGCRKSLTMKCVGSCFARIENTRVAPTFGRLWNAVAHGAGRLNVGAAAPCEARWVGVWRSRTDNRLWRPDRNGGAHAANSRCYP